MKTLAKILKFMWWSFASVLITVCAITGALILSLGIGLFILLGDISIHFGH